MYTPELYVVTSRQSPLQLAQNAPKNAISKGKPHSFYGEGAPHSPLPRPYPDWVGDTHAHTPLRIVHPTLLDLAMPLIYLIFLFVCHRVTDKY